MVEWGWWFEKVGAAILAVVTAILLSLDFRLDQGDGPDGGPDDGGPPDVPDWQPGDRHDDDLDDPRWWR